MLMDPYDELDKIRRRMKKLFGSEHEVGILTAHRGFVAPSVEISKKGGKLIVTARLPKVSGKDIDIKVTDDEIVIRGEEKKTKAGKSKGKIYSETKESMFYTAMSLPEKVDPKTARAEFKNGILTVTMKPKKKTLVMKETPKRKTKKTTKKRAKKTTKKRAKKTTKKRAKKTTKKRKTRKKR
ncbi:Hsp20/alpha crystallin family protein [Candidatus Micrarchaeota archaeon]|nr:Hsp20/alpha crystallin family protein [Candidatus Micrarchaeota archaeon]